MQVITTIIINIAIIIIIIIILNIIIIVGVVFYVGIIILNSYYTLLLHASLVNNFKQIDKLCRIYTCKSPNFSAVAK